ncbi:helix-turn-helix transcriptional regulator [Streptomyces sp. NPDC050145]|uniref:helix-turn-helix transcriptional regulator n=1 Tax=Streptomyces sp. NPDC050145 TaxID=3365602 RepID=UPI00379EBC3C
MTSQREPRLADAAEIAAEQGLTPARISGLYKDRADNGFPESVATRGRARLWNHAEVTAWFAQRPKARLRGHTPPKRDPDELLTAAEASRFLGYKSPTQVTTYLHDHPGYFPSPDVTEEMGTPENPYRRHQWRVQTLLDWMATRPGRGKQPGVKRAAPALPEVPADGDPDELLGASQAAALLSFKSLNSFSSSLAQGNLPLLETVDALTDKGGRRRWTRRRILQQAAERRR